MVHLCMKGKQRRNINDDDDDEEGPDGMVHLRKEEELK